MAKDNLITLDADVYAHNLEIDRQTIERLRAALQIRCRHAVLLTEPCKECASMTGEEGERHIIFGDTGIAERIIAALSGGPSSPTQPTEPI